MNNYKFKREITIGSNFEYDKKESKEILKLLKWLVELQSPSNTEEMYFFIDCLYEKICEENPNCKVETDLFGNIYVTKGVSKTYPLLIAHTDTNQELYGDLRMCILDDMIYGIDYETGEQAGLGLDKDCPFK